MKKMKKLSWLFLASLLVVFAACSNADDDDSIDGGGTVTAPAGSGTLDDPYNVLAAIKNNDSNKESTTAPVAWVKGYIVGQFKNYKTSDDGVLQLAPPFTSDNAEGTEYSEGNNILIADSKTETDKSRMVVVKIYDEYKTALNLVSNEKNLGAEVLLKGTLKYAYGMPGMSDLTAAKLNGKDIDGSTVPPVVVDPLISYLEEFSSITEGYKDANYWVPTWTCEKASGDRNWQGYIYTDKTTQLVSKFLQASAHDSKDANKGTHYESWVITPPLNVKEATEKVFSFRSSGNYWTATSALKVYVLSEPKSTAAIKKELNVNIATTGEYVWVESGDISLVGEGDVVYIGFCYIAEGGASNSTTYRIDDFAFGRKQVAHGGDETDEPSTGTDVDVSKAVTIADALSMSVGSEVIVKGYMVGCLKTGAKTSYTDIAAAAADLEWSAPFTGTTTVMLADNADESDPTKCIFIKLNDAVKDFPGATGLRDAVSLKDNPDNKGQVLAVQGTRAAMFKGLSGIRDMQGWKLVK